MNNNNNKVIIIGSGPAGLTAAIYAARGGLEPVVISGNEPGGQLMFTTDVENFPGFPEAIGGPDLMQNMRKQAERFGTKFIDAAVGSVDFLSRPFRDQRWRYCPFSRSCHNCNWFFSYVAWARI